MLAQVSKSQKAGEPIVFLAWSPHWMTVEFGTVFLEDPDEVWGGAGEIRTVTRAGFADENPEIAHLELNPVSTHPGGLDVLGARITLAPASLRQDSGRRAMT